MIRLKRNGVKKTTVLETPVSEVAVKMVPQDRDPLIQVSGVGKVYTTGAGDFTALKDISLDIYQGEFLGIIGKSGAGKTTLLNMISGVSEISSGEILFSNHTNGVHSGNGRPLSVHSMDEDQMAVWRGRNLGIVYQSFELMPQLDLLNNIMLPEDFIGHYRRRISRERAMELLELVELEEHAYKVPAHVSGGQKQRVAIARALVNDPPVIIADEPTGNLDTVTAETIFRIFERLVQQGKTIVMVTHDRNLESRFNRWIRISDGEIVDRSYNFDIKRSLDAAEARDPDRIVVTNTQLDFEKASSEEAQAHIITRADEIEIAVAKAGSADALLEKPSVELAASEVAIDLRGVVKTYENAAGKFTALKGIDLKLGYGQFVSIVGKSGSGKSTLLNMLTGIDHPTAGQVIMGGQDVYKMSESKRALWRGRNVGIVFQFFQLLPMLTLLENTILPMDYCNVYPANERPRRAMELLKMVGLEKEAHKLPASVSSGQQQSVAIARSLATDPPIIVADEPTGNLDSRSAKVILSLFREMSNRGKTILIVTHDPSFTKHTDQTVIISDGEIVDKTVANALPLLNHPQMLQATKQAERKVFSPGETIVRQGEPVENFFMIVDGEVDIVLNTPDCQGMSLARLGPGQFFGDVELMKDTDSIASVLAGLKGPVELALLPADGFYQLLSGSPPTREALERVAQARLEENLTQEELC